MTTHCDFIQLTVQGTWITAAVVGIRTVRGEYKQAIFDVSESGQTTTMNAEELTDDEIATAKEYYYDYVSATP